MHVRMSSGGYQRSLIIKLLALSSRTDKVIFKKISLFQNLLAKTLNFKPPKSLVTKV